MTLPPAPVSDVGKTSRNTCFGKPIKSKENIPPSIFERNKLSQTRVLAVSQSFLPMASATNGAVMVGRNAARK